MSARFDRLRRVASGWRPAVPGPADDGLPDDRATRPGESPDRFAGAMAVVIALTTLLAAVAGFLQAETSELAEDERLAATGLALEAAASAQRGQQQAQVEYSFYVRSVEQGTNAGSAQLRSMLAEADSTRQRQLLLEQERWQRLADATRDSSELGSDNEHGPAEDPTFPRRYFAAAREESHRVNALQDAHNERANRLDERGAAYTAILAILAVSVYLFGLTVAVSRKTLRRLFLAVGGVLVVAAGGWIMTTAFQPVEPVREEAASAFAAARVASETAYDNAGHAAARDHYARAIELRPTFAQAYLGRAGSTILAATPQRSGLVSVVPVDALRAGLADLRRARELGLSTARSEGSFGFYSLLEGIQTGDRGVLEHGLAATRRAVELDPAEPVYRLNLGLTLLSLERHEEAQAAYAEAAAWVLFHEADPQRPRDEAWLEELWLAGALTDLEVLGRHQPALAAQVEAQKEWLVGRIGAGSLEAPATTPLTVDSLVATVFPADLQWEAQLDGYDPERDTISTQWYHRPAGTDDWAVMPDISGSQPPTPSTEGGYYMLARYLGTSQPAACLPTGSYRLELYANGQLIGTADAEPGFGELEAAVARDLTLAYCRPADWQPIEEQLPGLLSGHRSPDGQSGVYGLRFDLPRSFGQLETLPELMLGALVESMPDLFPAAPVYLEDPGTTQSYFLGLSRTAWRWYDYGTGFVRAAAGLDDDGAVIVGLVYGPYDWFDGPLPDAIHDSMVRYE